jgi:hypothetical protein
MSPRRSPALLTLGMLALVIIFVVGAFFLWNGIGSWLAPKPTTTPIVLPTEGPTATRSPFEATAAAPTNTLSPDLMEVTPSPGPTLAYMFQNGYPPNYDPLTGIMLLNPSILDRRPIAVKVSNAPRIVRQWQSGLSLADNVYEEYIEDGLTRFIAVFYGADASRVGPVRSARYFDEHIARMYHAMYVFVGADERVRDYLLKTDLLYQLFTETDYNCPPLCRNDQVDYWQNVFLDTAGMKPKLATQGIDNKRQTLTGMYFNNIPPFSTNTASRIYNHFSDYDYSYWQYDAITQKYLRFQDTVDTLNGLAPEYAPLIDTLTGKQVTTDNVVVLFVRHIHNPQSSGQMYVVDLFNSGQAYIFRDGRVYDARWVRTANDALLSFTDPGGNPLPLKTGTTFFEVIGFSSTVTTSGQDWYFNFVMP